LPEFSFDCIFFIPTLKKTYGSRRQKNQKREDFKGIIREDKAKKEKNGKEKTDKLIFDLPCVAYQDWPRSQYNHLGES
jgi:hypothetical protein